MSNSFTIMANNAVLNVHRQIQNVYWIKKTSKLLCYAVTGVTFDQKKGKIGKNTQGCVP